MNPAPLRQSALSLLALLTMLISPALRAEPEVLLSSIKNYQPYSYVENGEITGLYNDIAREVFRRAEVPLRIELISFHSVLRKIRIGFSHVMIGALQTPERDYYADYLPTPLASISTSLFVHSDSDINDVSVAALKGKVIGIKQGFIMDTEFEAAANQGLFKRYEVETERQLVLMLLKGRIDGFIHTTERSLFYIEQLDKNQQIQLLDPPIVNQQPSFLAFSRFALTKLPQNLRPKIERALAEVAQDGTLTALHEKYALTRQAHAPSSPQAQ